MRYTYHINLDERGEFYADVRNARGDSILEIKGLENREGKGDFVSLNEMIEDGYMRHSRDVEGLRDYLVTCEVIRPSDKLDMATIDD